MPTPGAFSFVLVLLLPALLVAPVLAVGPMNALNDSGVVTYGDESSGTLATEPSTHPGQDARYGRDAAAAAGRLTKAGGGRKGFDFTKISNSGAALPASATFGSGPNEWGCTYDNVTGLMWEVKVNERSHPRHTQNAYTWYDSNGETNGGFAGIASTPGPGGYCHPGGRCDTEKFVQDVNAVGLCGYRDWRMPAVKELESLVDHGVVPGVDWPIDTVWFPNTENAGSLYWSGTAYAGLSREAWSVFFGSTGSAGQHDKGQPAHVRLVRSGQ